MPTERDPHGLDADGDGIACDSNPCPCSTRRTPLAGTTAVAPVKKTVVQYARVASVADGDTVNVYLSTGAYRRVRLVGIDTPEVYGGVQCGGPEASAAMNEPSAIVMTTRNGAIAFGRMCRHMIRPLPAPSMRAACT